MSLANNVDFLRRLPKLDQLNRLPGLGRVLNGEIDSPLVEVRDFGPNPGNLRMLAFVPEHLQQPRALVVVLHGCGQTAASYDRGAGWSTLARQFGFALLMPEQSMSNNANGCFNWFNPDDTTRERGEAASIRQMVARMIEGHGVDPRRVFVTGLSAGGAMTSVMLATYPEAFAAGAIIAGLPFGVARNVREALTGMRASPVQPPRKLGDLVRKASQHRGAWPKISVWHGSADRVVDPGNADEIVKQWLDLHHLPLQPMSEGVINGHPHRVWWNAQGETVVESYTVTDMAHGTPLGLADNDERYGAQGAFLIEAGISSSYQIAKFFGLTNWIHETANEAEPEKGSGTNSARLSKPSGPGAPAIPPVRMPDLADVLGAFAPRSARQESSAQNDTTQEEQERPPRRRGIDVGAVITRALTAAGLMK